MDVETTTAIERLNERIDKLETSVRGDIASLRADMNEGLAEGRSYTKGLIEDTNETLKIVADGVAHLSVKVFSASIAAIFRVSGAPLPGFDR